MMTAAQLLRGAGLAAVDARALLRHVLGWSAAQLASRADAPLPPPAVEAFGALVARRARGEPVAYITGKREFYSLSFQVAPAVLIPRPETELLVELALAHITSALPCRVLDLGTGSGCVALAIAAQRPQARVTAADNSQDALELAAANARSLGVRNAEFVHSDWFDALDNRRFDLIVANPPYIAEGDPHLREGDLRFEPRHALTAGVDGMDCIRPIVSRAGAHLMAGGRLMFEHGHDQAQACRELLRGAGFGAVFSRHDLAGIERVSGGSLLDGTPRETLN